MIMISKNRKLPTFDRQIHGKTHRQTQRQINTQTEVMQSLPAATLNMKSSPSRSAPSSIARASVRGGTLF